jgi:NAD(P)-dependent dehydrogenase (short-subunit alcohol dehydrogenase family)
MGADMTNVVSNAEFSGLAARYPSLAGRRVFITGGGSGIGASLVEGFARQGASVAFVDIAAEASGKLIGDLAQKGLPAPWFRHCDVTDIAALQAAIQDAATALGPFHVLVNNVASDDRHVTTELTPAQWDERMAINQRPAFFAIQAVLPGMRQLGGGSIINLGSVGWQTKTGGYVAYATAKSSALGLTRGLAKELGAHRIRINVVSPGWVMTERQLRLQAVPDMAAELARIQCIADPLQAPDIAAMVLFLAADDARACTAQEFIVDSGWS